MKANEVPEKLYIHKSQFWGLMANEHNITKDGIEYIRADAFIEKACEWMSSHLQMQYDGFSAFTKDFRKAMKGE